MTGRTDRWIRRTTIGCVALLALIAGTVSYLHMHVALGRGSVVPQPSRIYFGYEIQDSEPNILTR